MNIDKLFYKVSLLEGKIIFYMWLIAFISGMFGGGMLTVAIIFNWMK